MSTKKINKEIQTLFLTKPQKNSNSHVLKLTIHGMEKLALRMRRRNESIELMQKEQELDKQQMIAEVKKERIDAEKKGFFFKTCLVESEDKQPVKVTYSNKFGKIDVKHEPELRKALGQLFDKLYEKKNAVTVKQNVDVDQLKMILGEDKFNSLFDVESHIAAREEWMEKRFYLRSTLKDVENDLLDVLCDQIQHKPSVSF